MILNKYLMLVYGTVTEHSGRFFQDKNKFIFGFFMLCFKIPFILEDIKN